MWLLVLLLSGMSNLMMLSPFLHAATVQARCEKRACVTAIMPRLLGSVRPQLVWLVYRWPAVMRLSLALAVCCFARGHALGVDERHRPVVASSCSFERVCQLPKSRT
eukprot:673823-Amphidinium_carterae.1